MNFKKVKVLSLILLLAVLPSFGQEVLTLSDCRALAIENNKQLSVARLNKDIAVDARQAARTKYLPRVDAIAGYELFSKEISLLNNDQKTALNNLGTNATSKVSANLTELMGSMVQQGILTPQAAQQLGSQLGGLQTSIAAMGDELGSTIRQAFRTNNRNMFGGSVMLSQPLYMGGSITALNNIADLNEELTKNSYNLALQNTIYEIEATYWLVVSLKQKEQLADSYYKLVQQLSEDVHKMIDQGVATRADGLSIDVRVHEAELTKMKVSDNLALSKMLLCQLCGLDMNKEITLADENKESFASDHELHEVAMDRPEIRMLDNAISISEQSSKLVTAAYYRPQVALTGGYMISNPNVYNGFEHKFSGVWNIGILFRMPLWNWNEGRYKLHAAKAATNIAQLERDDLSEKIDLQVRQCRFNVAEANKRLKMSDDHVRSAEENLRCANVGFHEGVINLTEVMAAQTAWQSAKSEHIDAEIEVQLSRVSLMKALGQL
ncbi:MAG: TolC family protein [Prevotella sp.]|nr:TolC family protein [Prevotella sp.]